MSTGEPRAVRSRWSALPLFSAGLWGCTPANPPQGRRERERKAGSERERGNSLYVLLRRSPLSPRSRQRVHTLSAPDPRSRAIDVSVGTALNYRNVSPPGAPPFRRRAGRAPFNFADRRGTDSNCSLFRASGNVGSGKFLFRGIGSGDTTLCRRISGLNSLVLTFYCYWVTVYVLVVIYYISGCEDSFRS